MRHGCLLIGCTLAGIIGCLVFGDSLISGSLQMRRVMLVAPIIVGALAGFGLYELLIFLTKEDAQ
jgi:hypothetical protein